MANRKFWTESRLDELEVMRNNCCSFVKLAEHFNVSIKAIEQQLGIHGIKLGPGCERAKQSQFVPPAVPAQVQEQIAQAKISLAREIASAKNENNQTKPYKKGNLKW